MKARLIGDKLAITAHRPQTTRHAIRGILTRGEDQFIFVDTPGIHSGGKSQLNRVLNRTARASMVDADVVVLLVQALQWHNDDQLVVDAALNAGCPVLLAVNKIDTVERRAEMLPWLQRLPQQEPVQAIVPISARNGDGVDRLEALIAERLPAGEHVFGPDELTDQSSRFVAAEFIREQLTRQLNAELPYALTVEIEQFDEESTGLRIAAAIWVERDSQKAIVIGRAGSKLKEVGRRARERMRDLFGVPVHLSLWVKVRKDWSDDARALQSLGYRDPE